MLRTVSLSDVFWRAQCRLNLTVLRADPRAHFVPRGESLDLLADPPGPSLPRPSLCVVVTTHGRPRECRALIAALHESLRDAGLDRQAFVLVMLDAGDHDYGEVLGELAHAFGGRFALYEASRRLGKRGFWFTYQTAFRSLRRLRPDLVLFLQDDVTFERSFVSEALARWNAIEDPAKAVLSLCSMADDEPDGRWIRFARKDLPAARARLTQWFDLQAFLVNQRFFECLRFEVLPVFDARWRRDSTRSSGVGEQFTRRLIRRANVYQVVDTLVRHGQLPSLMNPEARAARPFDHGASSR